MRRTTPILAIVALVSTGCSQSAPAAAPSSPTTAAAPKLGIRPAGDTEIQPDMSQVPPDLQKVYANIDANIDQHVNNLQKWIQQPSISNSRRRHSRERRDGEGLLRGARAASTTRVFDTGITEYGTPGNPVVYAKCDEGAPKTVA